MAENVNSKLIQLNRWWVEPELINQDDKLREFGEQKYQFWPPFYENYPLDQDAIFILRGPRRVGKTTLLKLLVRRLLLEEKHNPPAVFYYSLERVADYDQLFNLIREYLNYARPRSQQRLHLFLDEVTFVDGWVRAIKDLADRGDLKNTTLTLTGSNVLELSASGERLPGRRGEIFQPDINFYPLHFGQFLEVVKPNLIQDDPQKTFQLNFAVLEKYLADYLLTGGFIFNINQFYKKEHLPPFVYEIFSSWVLGDMFKLKRSEDFTLRLLEQIPKHLTSTLSFSRLARDSGMASPATAQEYVELLERMFVLLRLPYFSLDEKRPDVKKNLKVYFQDPFILASMVARAEGVLDESYQHTHRLFDESFMPKLAELLVAARLNQHFGERLYYGMSGKRELDFVAKKGAQFSYYEVKYQKDLQASDVLVPPVLKGKEVTIITRNTMAREENKVLIPLAVWLAQMGKF